MTARSGFPRWRREHGSIFTLIFGLVAVLSISTTVAGEPKWRTLPGTPELPAPQREQIVPVDGANIWFAVYGSGEPVIMLHGGLANSSYWGNQIPELAKSDQVIVMDSRGHGRSSQNGKPFTYDRMVSDVVALMKHLQLPKSAIIGWSDGAIIALKLAIDHPERVSGVFAFAANSNPSGTHDLTNNEMFEKYKKRTREEFTKLSPTEFTYDDFYGQMMAMWTSQPDLTESDLHRIRVPVWIADGDHDEIIKRTDTLFIADNIPNSGLLIQPEVSHFSLLQDPHQFTKDVLCFLQAKGIGKSTSVSSGCRSG